MDYKPDLSPEQKLDIVLQKIVNTPVSDDLRYGIIANLVGASGYEKEIFEILLKLRKDGYVTSPNDSGHGNYVSNFDGRLFIDQGGYEAKASEDANDALLKRLEINRQRILDASLEKNSKRLNDLTLYLAIATAALALIEIVKFLIYLFPDLKIVFQNFLRWLF
jgi:hypothetical protein